MGSVVKPALRKDVNNSRVFKKTYAARNKQRVTQILQHINKAKIDNDLKLEIKNMCNNILK